MAKDWTVWEYDVWEQNRDGDLDGNIKVGEFETPEAAIRCAQVVVRDALLREVTNASSVASLLEGYFTGGMHSFIRGPTPVEFYSRDYAREIAPSLIAEAKAAAARAAGAS